VFRRLVRELRGDLDKNKVPPLKQDWTDKNSDIWASIRNHPHVPYNLNVLLEGMSLKNSRNKLIE
jgi:hypothetical protein